VIREEHQWDRDALEHLRHGRIKEWAKAYRDHGRLVAHASSERTRQALVGDWWRSARDGQNETVMLAHRRSDVADLNRRARQFMIADGRLGDEEITIHGRSFARGDQVLAKRNDGRLDIVNGARGAVMDIDAARRSPTVSPTSGETVKVDATYLDAGHLDRGYALTAHAARGITVDKSFVLGSDDLYREWGYTALTRHRIEARYYVVSDGSAAVAPPGLEPQPDRLIDDVAEALGSSRHKQLARDAANGPIPQTERPAGSFAELRALDRDTRRTSDESARVEARIRDAELRLGALEAEFEATPRLRVGARSSAALAREQDALDAWRARSREIHDSLVDLDVRRASVRDLIGLDPAGSSVEPPSADMELAADHCLDLDDGIDFGP